MDQTIPPPSADSIASVLSNTAIAFIVMETAFVAFRYVSRYMIRAPTGVDDFLIPFAWLFNVALCGITIAMVNHGGVGHHTVWVEAEDPEAIITFMKLQIPLTVMYAMAVMFPKLAILGLYLRIFTKQWHRVSCFTLIAVVSATGVSIAIVTCLQCRPISALWDVVADQETQCIDIPLFWRWGSFPNIMTDLLMLTLPIPCIWRLQLSTRDKIGLVLTFATGSVGTVTSIIRFTTFFYTDAQADPTWAAVQLGCCSIAEPGVYTMAACLPTYRSLLRNMLRRMGISTGSSRDPDTARSGDHSVQLARVRVRPATKERPSSDLSLDGSERTDNDERTLVSNTRRTHLSNNPFDPSVERGEMKSSCDAACRTENDSSPVFGAIHVEREIKIVTSRRDS